MERCDDLEYINTSFPKFQNAIALEYISVLVLSFVVMRSELIFININGILKVCKNYTFNANFNDIPLTRY